MRYLLVLWLFVTACAAPPCRMAETDEDSSQVNQRPNKVLMDNGDVGVVRGNKVIHGKGVDLLR